MAQRQRPARSSTLVFNPERDTNYTHFADAAQHPFNPTASWLDRRNAWWLADAALLAYWNTDDARRRFARAGLTAEDISRDGTDGYLATGDRFAIVTFRGTQPGQLSDIIDDLKAIPVPWQQDGATVHLGFKKALERVWEPLSDRLERLATTHSIWFTGHSLGAAIATLAADRFEKTAGVLTVGSPRVGNARFAATFSARLGARSRRYVAAQDIVTRLPTSWFGRYDHVSRLCRIDRNGTIAAPSAGSGGGAAEWWADLRTLASGSNPLRRAAASWAPDGVLDHMPSGYAVDIWNDYDGNGDT